MEEFWEKAFQEKQLMWGHEPIRSAIAAAALFSSHNIKRVLIPGIGYGRNAEPFLDREMAVTGIEISGTAVNLAAEKYGAKLKIYHGSVLDMPFDNQLYEGIFCHALIHLLEEEDRLVLIQKCYNQLAVGGSMVFTAINKQAGSFGKGVQIGKDQFEQHGGVRMFFYDEESVQEEFKLFGVKSFSNVLEDQSMYFIYCVKEA